MTKEKKLLLLVEDEGLISKAEANSLRKYGYEVMTVTSGQKAIEAVRSEPGIDLVLMDINLGKGKMDGTVAAEKILQIRDLPLIFLSSHTESEIVEKTELISSYGYVVKNCGITVLDASIKMAFRLFEAKQEVKRHLEEVRESEERFRTIVNSMPQFVCFTDKDLKYRFVNRTYLEKFGVEPQEILGKPLKEVIGDDAFEKARPHVEKALNGEKVTYTERYNYALDGTRDIDGVLLPQVDRGGKVSGYYAVLNDVTTYMELIEQLRESEERYRSLFTADHSIMLLIDPETGDIVDANPGAVDFYGWTCEEITGMKIQEINLLTEEEVKQEMRDAREQKRTSFSFRHLLKSGDVRDVEVYSGPIVVKNRKLLYSIIHDVTARKELENELMQSRRLLIDAERIARLGSWKMDVETGCSVWSDEFFRICGLEPGSVEPTAELGFSIIHPEDREQARKEVERAIETGGDYHIEKRIVRSDGEVRHVIAEGEIIQDEDGKPKTLIGTFLDVTDRKHLAARLHEDHEKLRVIIDTAIDTIFVKDLNGAYRMVNPAMEKLFGMSADEIIGKTDTELFGEVAGNGVIESDAKVFRGETVAEFPQKPVQGRVRAFHTIKVPMYDTDGNITGLCGIARDITEHKEAEIALKKSEKRYRNLLESISDSVYVLDKDWNHVVVNDAAVKFTGIPKERLLGSSLLELFPGVEDTAFFSVFQKVMGEGRPDMVQNHYAFPDGREGWYEVTVYPVTEGILCISRDMTERKRVEQELSEKTRLLDLVARNMYDMVALVNSESEFTWVSPSHEELLGYSPEFLRGRSIFEFVHPEDREQILAAFSELQKTGGPVQHELRYRTTSGEYIWIEAVGKVSYDATANPEGFIINSRDITERKNAEDAVRKSEERFKSLAELLPQTVFELDTEAGFTFVNRAGLETFGYTEEDLKQGLSAFHMIAPEDRERAQHYFTQGLKDRQVRSNEYNAITRDGRIFPAFIYSNPVVENGVVTGVRGILTDITDLKQFQEVLRISEEKFRSIAEQLSDLIALTDENGIITYASPASENLFGMTQEEMTENHFMTYLDESVIQKAVSAFKDTVQKGKMTVNLEILAKRKDGTRFIGELTGRRFMKGTLVTIRDITKRKRAELKLKESEAKLKGIIDNSSDIIWSMSYPDFKPVLVSPAAEKVYGYPWQRFIEEPFLFEKLTHPDDRHTTERALTDLNETGEAVRECRIVRADGEIRHIQDRSKLIYDQEGRPERVDGITTDISEKKLYEESIKQRLHEKELLLQELQHRVKNSFTAIDSIVYLEQDRHDNPEVREALMNISSRIISMSELYLMLYESGSVENVDMAEYCMTVVQSLAATYENGSGRIDIDMDYDPIVLDMKSALLAGQLFTELITNSCKYAFPDGRSGTITASLKQQDDTVTLSVTDDGVGLPGGFDLSKNSGTGLEIVQGLVGQLDGTLEIAGKGGVRVTVSFPVL